MREKVSKALKGSGLGGLKSLSPLHSGDWASVYRLDLDDGARIAAKVGHPGHEGLMVKEAAMLNYLDQKVPGLFPQVKGLGEGVLLLGFVENNGQASPEGPAEAGAKLAALHNHGADGFGFDTDTIFGPSPQPNPWTKHWPAFYREHRLIFMGRIAVEAKRISAPVFARLENFSARLENLIPSSPKPALLHGDFWGGNVLYNRGRLAAFIDPAIYYGDAEVDLAFATLFGAPGPGFFEAYSEIRRIEPGFEERVDIYNLWGLLFHAYWFGGGYANQVKRILSRFGY